MIDLTINGRQIKADEGTTVLEVARSEGIDIPTLCYHRALGPYGVCRLCVVEAEGPGLVRTVASSCNFTVSEGLIVETDSSLIRTMRRTIVELLLASEPVTEPLREIARRLGVETTRFTSTESDHCVLCGLCVRVCREKIGAAALSFAGRPDNRHVVAGEIRLDPEACIGCGTCAMVCPVAAISSEDRGYEREIVLYGDVANRLELLRCDFCGAPSTTRKFLDMVISRMNDEQKKGMKNLCPDCARRYYAVALTGQFLF